MRWRQFFTPVQSIDTRRAREMIETTPTEGLTILDVRQPGEYEIGHLPGAHLIPLPDLGDRLDELDAGRPTVVYCAVGGRSRVAAQMLAGRGFDAVFNMAGGFKAWNGNAAVGLEESGMALFTGRETPREALIVAYSLEQGLQDFYLSMVPNVDNGDVKALFAKLADIEIKHQDRLFETYTRITDAPLSREAFVEKTVAEVVEGGLTTDDYIRLFAPDLDSPQEVIGLAMSIEAQALDLYLRAARASADADTRQHFVQIADEEKAHLQQLGELIERLT
ncbi:MAG: rhodanese-like domain-containing protein [Desulfobacterales bacterium]|jgi:rhodanese-related sulfurtransferase/rubrerythrin